MFTQISVSTKSILAQKNKQIAERDAIISHQNKEIQILKQLIEKSKFDHKFGVNYTQRFLRKKQITVYPDENVNEND